MLSSQSYMVLASVHGDFRSPNILVHDSGQVCVIDFEWSGKIGVASYQFFMNLVDI